VKDLYKNQGTVLDSVLQITNHLSLATGVDLKSMPVAPGPR
jgi:hypothetical protein